MYFSEYIGTSFMQWDKSSVVTLETQPGTGKTHWIFHEFLRWAAKNHIYVTYFCNRRILKLQMKELIARAQGIIYGSLEELDTIHDFNGISIYSYQEIESGNIEDNWLDWEGFSVYDECHYFLEDALFNPLTTVSWEFVKKRMSYGGSIFISATMQQMKPLIEDAIYTTDSPDSWLPDYRKQKKLVLFKYVIPPNYDYLEIFYYEDENEIKELIEKTNQQEKWLIFVSSIAKAEEKYLCLERQDCQLITAADRESMVMEDIVRNQRFSCRVLFTTKVLDNGISLVDKNLKYIVLDTINEIDALQMVGRKRITSPNEKVILFVKKKKIHDFQGVIHFITNPAVRAFALFKKSEEEFFQTHIRNTEGSRLCGKYFAIHSSGSKINPLAMIKIKNIENFCNKMMDAIKAGDDDASIKQQLLWFGKEADFSASKYLSKQEQTNYGIQLLEYLNDNIGDISEKEKQMEFREGVKSLIQRAYPQFGLRSDRKIGLNLINKFFQEYNLPYEVIYGKSGDQRTQTLMKKENA